MLPSPDNLSAHAWLDNAVLVYGPRKSGTTLFQNLLDGGDQLLAYPPEMKLKYYAARRLHEDTAEAYFGRSLVGQTSSLHFSFKRYHELWSPAIASGRAWPVGDLVRFDVWCVSQSTNNPPARLSIWSAKEVAGGGHRDVLALWRRFFTPGRALFLVRDPLSVTRAILNQRRREGRRLSVGKIVHETLAPLRVMRQQSRYLGDPNVHFTAYEDLVADPQREMSRIAAFLGIDASPAFSSPTLFGEPVVVRTASQKTTDVFQSAGSWREGLSRREVAIVSAATRAAAAIPWLALDYEGLRQAISESAGRRDLN